MPKTNTESTPITFRVPIEVAEWLKTRGGTTFVKSMLIMEWHRSTFYSDASKLDKLT